MSMYKQFKTDESLETSGITIDYGDFRVLIARAGGSNKRYQRVMEAKTKPFRRAIQTETMNNDRSLEILYEAYAEAIVLNWETKVDGKWQKGIENPDGEKLLPFKPENVIATFKALPDLFTDIKDQAEKAALFLQSVNEEEAEN